MHSPRSSSVLRRAPLARSSGDCRPRCPPSSIRNASTTPRLGIGRDSTPPAANIALPIRMPSRRRPRVLQLFTVDQSLVFVRDQLDFLSNAGLSVTVACADGPMLDELSRSGILTEAIPFTRRWSPLADLRAIGSLVSLMRRAGVDIVHASTPKAGLLGMVAAQLVGAPVRVYHMRGLPYLSEQGARRHLLRAIEWLTCRLAQHVVCVSESLRSIVVSDGVAPPHKVVVLGAGSGNGVDVIGRFNPDVIPAGARNRCRDQLQIPRGAFLFAFIGRFARAKGLEVLHSAWRSLGTSLPNAYLLLVGAPDSREPFAGIERFRQLPRTIVMAPTADVQQVYAAIDVLVLPTYREGLSNVLLEAGAMARAVIASAVVGCVDVVEDEQTGLLVPAGDSKALAEAMVRYYKNPGTAEQHGIAARVRVSEMFNRDRVWAALLNFYVSLIPRVRRDDAA